VLTHRFGLDGEPPQPLRVIGQRLVVAGKAIRQIAKQALEKLR
jgi:DNA-directed RNA polymerase sigma subunit (sigma70/sigma32)